MSDFSAPLIMGDTVEEKMQSMAKIIDAVNRKPRGRNIVKQFCSAPCLAELRQSGVVYPIILTEVKGFIGNFLIFVENTASKNIVIQLNITTKNEIKIIKCKALMGFTKENGIQRIEGATFISASYTIPEGELTTPPIIGLTFKEEIENGPNQIES